MSAVDIFNLTFVATFCILCLTIRCDAVAFPPPSPKYDHHLLHPHVEHSFEESSRSSKFDGNYEMHYSYPSTSPASHSFSSSPLLDPFNRPFAPSSVLKSEVLSNPANNPLNRTYFTHFMKSQSLNHPSTSLMSSPHHYHPINHHDKFRHSNESKALETVFVLKDGGYQPSYDPLNILPLQMMHKELQESIHKTGAGIISNFIGPKYGYGTCHPGSLCVPLYECIHLEKHLMQEPCELGYSGSNGICCPKHDIMKTSKESHLVRPIQFMSSPLGSVPYITAEDINAASEKARRDVRNLVRLERELEERGLVTGRQSSEDNHHRFFSNELEAKNHSFDGFVTVRSSIELMRKFKINPFQAITGLKQLSFINTAMMSHCLKQDIMCDYTSKYRTADGSCNNLQNPIWGKSFTPFNRLLPAMYGDGIDSPRRAMSGLPLPNTRVISFTLSPETKTLSKYFTHLLMQWGQFIDHDITRTAIQRTFTGKGILCCNPEFDRNPRLLHPSCFPIEVPEDDPFYSKFRSTCMNFVRSAPAPSTACSVGPREQLSQSTPFIDTGMIYGATQEIADSIRTFEGGKLTSSTVDGREFLPQTDTIENCNIPPQSGLKCFLAGDNRVNMQVSLVTLQALFLRHHNRIAETLQKLNPSWSDEILYQETKRIVNAQVQHITYNEYLPLIIGKKVMESFDLLPSDHSVDSYDDSVNPQIVSGFSTAAFRLHTTVRATIPFRDAQNRVIGQLDLSDTFLNPSVAYTEDAFPEMLNGLTGAAMTKFDRFFTTEVTHHLFRRFNASFGLDLVAINIQRGRDHGIPPYNAWRKLCGLPVLHSFEDLNHIMDPDAAAKIATLYESVDDVDFFVGGNSEYHIKGAIVGPTFACVIAEQFRRLKVGDRFWYENKGQTGSFTDQQLQEIKRTSLASIFCEDEITAVQKLAFIRPFERWNPRISCENHNRLNLRAWRDLEYWKKK